MLLELLYKNRFYFEADTGDGGGTAAAPEGETPDVDPSAPPQSQTPESQVGGDVDTEGEEPLQSAKPGTDTQDVEIEEEQIDVPPYPGSSEHQQRSADPEVRRQSTIVQQLTAELEETRQRLEQYELADMDEDDQRMLQLQRREQQLQQRQSQIEAQEVNSTWRNYYSQWPGVEPTDLEGQGPIEWQHSVLTRYANTIHNQNRQITALKDALKGQQKVKPEPTSRGSASPVGRKTIYQTPWDEIERRQQLALKGQLRPEDYLPVS